MLRHKQASIYVRVSTWTQVSPGEIQSGQITAVGLQWHLLKNNTLRNNIFRVVTPLRNNSHCFLNVMSGCCPASGSSLSSGQGFKILRQAEPCMAHLRDGAGIAVLCHSPQMTSDLPKQGKASGCCHWCASNGAGKVSLSLCKKSALCQLLPLFFTLKLNIRLWRQSPLQWKVLFRKKPPQ